MIIMIGSPYSNQVTILSFDGSIEVELKWALENKKHVVLRKFLLCHHKKNGDISVEQETQEIIGILWCFTYIRTSIHHQITLNPMKLPPPVRNTQTSTLHATFFRTQEWGFAAKTPGGLEDPQIDDLSGNYWKSPSIVDLFTH